MQCSGTACGGGSNRYGSECDPDGCDYVCKLNMVTGDNNDDISKQNSYRQGAKSFYGPGMTVNTNSKFTVVTQVCHTMNRYSKPVSHFV